MSIKPRFRSILKSPLRNGFVDLLTASYAIQFLGFGTLLLVPRFVSPEELGELKVIQSFIGLFSIFAGFGFNTSVLKLCSENREADERESILLEALWRTMVSSAITFALVILFARAGLLGETEHIQKWIIIYALVLPFDTATNLFGSYLQSQKRIRELARAQLLVKLQAVGIILLATWQFGFEGFVIATIIGYAIGLVPFIGQIGTGIFRAARIRVPKLFWSIATYSSLANGINTLGRHADIYILGLFYHDPKDLGYYALAKIFLSGANVVTSTAQRIALPYLSEDSENEGPFRRLVRTSQIQTLLMSIVVAIGMHFGAAIIIRFVYHEDYSTAIQYLDILLIKYVVWSGFAILGIAIIAMGRPAFNLIGACLTAPIALGLSYHFLSTAGTVGVAWSQVAAAAASLVILIGLYFFASKKHFSEGRNNA